MDSSEQVSSTDLQSHGNWGSLPEELQDKVVACMPFRNIFQFRSVSKGFRDIHSRLSFQQETRPIVRKFAPMVFFFNPATRELHWLGFDRISKEWSRLPSLSSLATPDADLSKEFVVAGSGGLLCVNVSNQPDVEQLKICNPVTGGIRELPRMNFPRQPVVMTIITLDKDTTRCQVIVAGNATAGSEELSRKTEVYDSATGEWKVTGDVTGPEYALNEYQTGAYSEGILYCLGILEEGNVTTRGVLAYDVESEKWIQNWPCTLPSLQCCQHATSSTTTQIFESEGSIFLYWEQEHSGTLVHFCVAKLECLVDDTSHRNSSVDDISTYDSPFWSVLVSKRKSGFRGLLVYPEYTAISHGLGKVCIFNTLDLTGSVHKVGDIGRPAASKPSPLDPVPETILRGSGRPLFFPLNPLNFSFELSFHTPV